jgi:hypothetical protein
MLEGLILVVLGVALLWSAPAFARDAGAANRKLLGERFGRAQTSVNVGFGVVVGVAAIVSGVIWAVVEMA